MDSNPNWIYCAPQVQVRACLLLRTSWVPGSFRPLIYAHINFFTCLLTLKDISSPNNIQRFTFPVFMVTCEEPEELFDKAMMFESAKATEICYLFAEYFSTVFGDVNVAVPVFDFSLNHTNNRCIFSAIDVQRKLESLDPNKGAGPDGIPPAVFKICAQVLAPHLTIYSKKLHYEGIFPSPRGPKAKLCCANLLSLVAETTWKTIGQLSSNHA